MLFNTLSFAIFFAIVFTVYWAMKTTRQQNVVLLAASYYFYANFNFKLTSLLLLSTAIAFAGGIALASPRGKLQAKTILSACISTLLGILFLFKYFDFFISSVNATLDAAGLPSLWTECHLILPIGISFYIFQCIAYLVDTYNDDSASTSNVLNFFTFISFFPQLVAGPIERSRHILAQLATMRPFSLELVSEGMLLVLWGLVLKCVLADTLALPVDSLWENPGAHSGNELLLGTFFFSFQIYGDFAGYSLIAIGTARMLGLELITNFRYPYFSKTAKEFWTRWHISLSRWFRDYVYIQLLGGKYVSRPRRTFNVAATFLLSGLWHGANWTFVFWGAVHACLYFADRLIGYVVRNKTLQCLLTFLFVSFAWVFFRSDSLPQAFLILAKSTAGIDSDILRACGKYSYEILITIIVIAIEFLTYRQIFHGLYRRSPIFRTGIHTACFFLLFFAGEFQSNQFIYFQF